MNVEFTKLSIFININIKHLTMIPATKLIFYRSKNKPAVVKIFLLEAEYDA